MTPEALESLLRDRLGLSNVRVRGENITACCPSHNESRPSWGIRTDEPHVHSCFSCGYKGTVRTLLIDRGWNLSAVNSLLGKYKKPSRGLTLSPEVYDVTTPNEEDIWPFVLEPDAIRYMRSRGITWSTLKVAKVVYHPLDQRVLFPWYLNGQFFGATGRSIDPENLVKIQAYFAIRKRDVVYSPTGTLRASRQALVIVEGEIDALKVFQSGHHNVVALGHGNVSPSQMRLFRSLPVNSKFVLFLDDDITGRRLSHALFKELTSAGFRDVKTVDYGLVPHSDKLDPGMLPGQIIRKMIRRAKKTSYWFLDRA